MVISRNSRALSVTGSQLVGGADPGVVGTDDGPNRNVAANWAEFMPPRRPVRSSAVPVSRCAVGVRLPSRPAWSMPGPRDQRPARPHEARSVHIEAKVSNRVHARYWRAHLFWPVYGTALLAV